MTIKDLDAVVAGHLCLDIIPPFQGGSDFPVEQLFRPGASLGVGPATLRTGGAVANTGLALARIGSSVAFCARVGDDALSRLTVEILCQGGSTDGIRRCPGVAGSYTVVLAPPGVDRIFLHYSGPNDSFGLEDIDFSLIERARILHFGYPPLMRRIYIDGGRELALIFQEARACGAIVSLDMALFDPTGQAAAVDWPAFLATILPHVDLFLPSAEEALLMLDPTHYIDLCRTHPGLAPVIQLSPAELVGLTERLLSFGAAIVGLKCGPRGLLLRTADRQRLEDVPGLGPARVLQWADRQQWCPAYRPLRIRSSTGAGDCLHAGFLKGLLEGLPLEQVLRVSTAMGYFNLLEDDAISGIPPWEVVLSFAANHSHPLLDPGVNTAVWDFQEDTGLWARNHLAPGSSIAPGRVL
ncbi:MAG: carbohydrate kinase family protein [Coprothermobacterota bacterium]|nr:carbohydrate kinase family protein [Coprothermobacterota bacterium]